MGEGEGAYVSVCWGFVIMRERCPVKPRGPCVLYVRITILIRLDSADAWLTMQRSAERRFDRRDGMAAVTGENSCQHVGNPSRRL